MWSGLLGGDLIRWCLALRCPPGPLKSYYRTDTPTLDTPYTRAEFLAVDLETTTGEVARLVERQPDRRDEQEHPNGENRPAISAQFATQAQHELLDWIPRFLPGVS